MTSGRSILIKPPTNENTLGADIARPGELEFVETIDSDSFVNGSASLSDPVVTHGGVYFKPGDISIADDGHGVNVSAVVDVKGGMTDTLQPSYNLTVTDNSSAEHSHEFDGMLSDRLGPTAVGEAAYLWIGNEPFERAYLRSNSDDSVGVDTSRLRQAIDDW